MKSAQVPFSPWISRALEGPTPSSAVFYGSLMVHAGVYLLIRLQPVFEQTPLMMVVILLFGLLTVAYGYLCTLVQTDVKSTLMFSTTAQVGLMFVECGLGLFELAAWHLAIHAIWRAYQFLLSPAHMHLMSRPTRAAPAWLRKRRWLFTAAINRFWLDPVSDWLLTHPTQQLARDNPGVRRPGDRTTGRHAGPCQCDQLPGPMAGAQGPTATLQRGRCGHKAWGWSGKLMEGIASSACTGLRSIWCSKAVGEGLDQPDRAAWFQAVADRRAAGPAPLSAVADHGDLRGDTLRKLVDDA